MFDWEKLLSNQKHQWEGNKKVVWGTVIVGFLLAIAGFSEMYEANAAPTLVGVSCFLGIAARIIQAEIHQSENLKPHDDDADEKIRES